MPTFYAIKVDKEDLYGEVIVNDVPLLIWRDTKPAISAQGINPWITGRMGRVTVVLEWPSSDRPQSLSPRLTVDILAGPRADQTTGEAELLVRFHWPQGRAPGRPEQIGFEFEARDPPPSTFWSRAEEIALDTEALAGARAVLADLHSALDRRDLARAVALLDFKAVDVGRAMYWPADRARQSQRDFLEFVMESEGWAMEPLGSEKLRFRLVADRHLVWATREDSQPALQSSPTKSPRLLLPVYLAPVDHIWTVVR